MSQQMIVVGERQIDQSAGGWGVEPDVKSSENWAESITKAASRQTHNTIRFLVDRDRVADAYRAYGYFRWVDDCLDGYTLDQPDSIAFVERQQALVNRAYLGECPRNLTHEEQLLIDLIQSDKVQNSGLQCYIRHLMMVMTFDARRRGHLISQQELSEYSQHLAIAVTEALHYFIGHDDPAPQSDIRYFAVTGAHITHMLRDTLEDVAAGYFNIPGEFLELHGIQPTDMDTGAYREWVRDRVQLARVHFRAGKEYLARVRNRRCRLAGWAYMVRFEAVLDAIERQDYRLQPECPQRSSLGSRIRMGRAMLSHWFTFPESGQLVTPE